MNKKVVIAGGTGFIGRYFRKRFIDIGFDVQVISRQEDVRWSDSQAIRQALEGADLLINMAGKSVDCRYNKQNKRLILQSRVETTLQLQDAINRCQQPPRLWINSSTATIYRHAEDRPMDEASGELGSGFSVEVAKAWEGAFFKDTSGPTRKIALRTAITLGQGGGVMQPYIRLMKAGLGGAQGNGKQMFSWIHIEDLFRIAWFMHEHEDMQGVYNCSSPRPVTNKVFMKYLRSMIRPWAALPVPIWLLKIGALLIGTETELVLKSRWVLPMRLQKRGFIFKYPHLQQALKAIIP